MNLTSAGSGEQKLVLDLTSAGNGPQRLDGIGSGDTLAGAPSGDLIVTASGSGSGGGFVDVKSASSTASVDTRLTNTISAGAVLSGLDVVVRTDNRGNVASISTNGGGGFVSIGSADTSASLVSTTTLTVAAGATLTATRNLTVDAGATAAGNATAGTNSAGLGSGVHANASLTLRYTHHRRHRRHADRGRGPDGPLAHRGQRERLGDRAGRRARRRHRRDGDGHRRLELRRRGRTSAARRG